MSLGVMGHSATTPQWIDRRSVSVLDHGGRPGSRRRGSTGSRSPAEFDAGRVYAACREYVLAVLARRCGWLAADEREETLHDAFVTMLEKARRQDLDPPAMRPPQVRAFLVQTAIHKALDEGKRAGRSRSQPLVDEVAAVVADPAPGPAGLAEAHEDRAQVDQLISELPERQQMIVRLRHLLGFTPGEIQEHLGITQRTYRRQLERAMGALSERRAALA